jgi:hypothetical protein
MAGPGEIGYRRPMASRFSNRQHPLSMPTKPMSLRMYMVAGAVLIILATIIAG